MSKLIAIAAAACLAASAASAQTAGAQTAGSAVEADRAFAQSLQLEGSNPAEARRLSDRAAELGHGRAAWARGMRHIEGDGVAADQREALKWFRISAAAGDVMGLHAMGVMNAGGMGGLAPNLAEARAWYEKAAAKGYAGSLAALGGMLHNGQGGASDPVRARAYVELAFEAGDETAKEIMPQLPRDLTTEQRLAVDRIKAAWVSAHGKPKARSQ